MLFNSKMASLDFEVVLLLIYCCWCFSFHFVIVVFFSSFRSHRGGRGCLGFEFKGARVCIDRCRGGCRGGAGWDEGCQRRGWTSWGPAGGRRRLSTSTQAPMQSAGKMGCSGIRTLANTQVGSSPWLLSRQTTCLRTRARLSQVHSAHWSRGHMGPSSGSMMGMVALRHPDISTIISSTISRVRFCRWSLDA